MSTGGLDAIRAPRPASLVVGVTGHRTFADLEQVQQAIESVFDRILDGVATIVIVSSLAEGADRLVAEMLLSRGATLEVILPLAIDDYAEDFATDESKAHFAALVAAAAAVSVVGPAPETREHAYEMAGRAMVERSDVVMALWDGAPSRGRGGTAEIILYALDVETMVEVVLVDRDPA